VDNFLKGKYKRFAVLGPVQLRIVIARNKSPNATVAGVFLGELKAPGTGILDLLVPNDGAGAAVPEDLPPPVATQAAGEQALAALSHARRNREAIRIYLQAERMFMESMAAQRHQATASYLGSFVQRFQQARERLVRAHALMEGEQTRLELDIMHYLAARGLYDYGTTEELIGRIMALILPRGKVQSADSDERLALGERLCTHLLEQGRRAEAALALNRYGEACLARLPADESRKRLLTIGRKALRSGVPVPVAKALERWEQENHGLDTDAFLLLANLNYVGGRNGRAAKLYRVVEKRMLPGTRHQWVMVAYMTSLLRSDRETDALEIFERLRDEYPNTAAIDDAWFRLGRHYFEEKQFDLAQQTLTSMRDTTASVTYRKMCEKYLTRIDHELTR